MNNTTVSKKHAYVLWLIASGLLFYEILLRVFPNIIVSHLQTHFNLDTAGLGIFSAAFILAYGVMQLPVGMLIDRYGIRLTLSLSMLIAGCSVFSLPYIHSIWAARISRFLMGTGCAGAFLACMQVIRLYFPSHLRAILTGFTVTIGALAGLVCNSGLIWVVKLFNWHVFILVIAMLGFSLMALVWIFFPKHDASLSEPRLFQNFLIVLSNPFAWLVGAVCTLMYLPYAMFNDLWGQSFFRVTDHLTTVQAGLVISSIWLGWVFGGPFWGWLSFKQKSLLKPISGGIAFQFIALSGLIFCHQLSLYANMIIALCLGFGAAAMNLCYVLGQRINPKQSASSSTAMINTLVTLGVIVYLPLVGWWLNFLSPSVETVLRISSTNYVAVFSSFLFVMLFCFGLIVFAKKLNYNLEFDY